MNPKLCSPGIGALLAEYMGQPYLCEATHAEEPVHGARAFVAVHRPQLSPPEGQVPVRVLAMLVCQHMEGAVHWSQLVLLILHL